MNKNERNIFNWYYSKYSIFNNIMGLGKVTNKGICKVVCQNIVT